MSGGGGGSKQTSTSTSTPYQQKQYNTLLKGADSWLSQGGFDNNYGGAEGFDPVANMTPEQQAALQGSYGTGQAVSGLYGTSGLSSLSDYLGAYDPNKTGLTSAIDAMNNQSNFNFETQVNPQIRQGAQGAGQYGSSRHGIAEGLARSQLSQQQMNNASTMAFQDQQAYNQNRLGVLNNLSGITKGLNSGYGLQYDAGKLQQDQNQAEIQGDLQKWLYENNVGLNDLLAYQSLVSGDMGGTNTSVTKGSGGGSSPFGAIAAVGGAALGGMFGGLPGAGLGASLGGQLGNGLS